MLLVVTAIALLVSVPLAGGRLTRLADIRVRAACGRCCSPWRSRSGSRTSPRAGATACTPALNVLSYLLDAYFIFANRRLAGVPIVARRRRAQRSGDHDQRRRDARERGRTADRGDHRPRRVRQLGALAHPHLAFLGDVFPVPGPWPIGNVLSVGDLIIFVGALVVLHRACGSRLLPRRLPPDAPESRVMREVRPPESELPLEAASFLACLATILELPFEQLPQPPPARTRPTGWTVSRWLGGLGLGLARIADPARSPGRDRGSGARRPSRFVVMYGVPSGRRVGPGGRPEIDRDCDRGRVHRRRRRHRARAAAAAGGATGRGHRRARSRSAGRRPSRRACSQTCPRARRPRARGRPARDRHGHVPLGHAGQRADADRGRGVRVVRPAARARRASPERRHARDRPERARRPRVHDRRGAAAAGCGCASRARSSSATPADRCCGRSSTAAACARTSCATARSGSGTRSGRLDLGPRWRAPPNPGSDTPGSSGTRSAPATAPRRSKISRVSPGRPGLPGLLADLLADLRGLLVEHLRGPARGVTVRPSSSSTPWWTHCQICEREISAVAASSISELIAAAPRPVSQNEMY